MRSAIRLVVISWRPIMITKIAAVTVRSVTIFELVTSKLKVHTTSSSLAAFAPMRLLTANATVFLKCRCLPDSALDLPEQDLQLALSQLCSSSNGSGGAGHSPPASKQPKSKQAVSFGPASVSGSSKAFALFPRFCLPLFLPFESLPPLPLPSSAFFAQQSLA